MTASTKDIAAAACGLNPTISWEYCGLVVTAGCSWLRLERRGEIALRLSGRDNIAILTGLLNGLFEKHGKNPENHVAHVTGAVTVNNQPLQLPLQFYRGAGVVEFSTPGTKAFSIPAGIAQELLAWLEVPGGPDRGEYEPVRFSATGRWITLEFADRDQITCSWLLEAETARQVQQLFLMTAADSGDPGGGISLGSNIKLSLDAREGAFRLSLHKGNEKLARAVVDRLDLLWLAGMIEVALRGCTERT